LLGDADADGVSTLMGDLADAVRATQAAALHRCAAI